MNEPPPPAGPAGRAPSHPVDRGRLLAAGVCGLQTLVLAGFCVFYAVELARGVSSDTTRVVMSIVLIAAFAVVLGALARAWLSGADWPNTPTVVWNVLLLPVAWGLVQAGRGLVGALVGAVAIVGIVSAIAANTTPD